MKYYSYSVSFCVVLLSGMMHAKNLWVENKTDDLLNLVVSKGGSEVTLPLFAGKLQVLEEPEKLTTLYVEPTGIFSRGFWGGKTNLAAQAKGELEKVSQDDLALTIEPSSLLWLKTSFKPQRLELLQPSSRVIRYFPQVVRVIQAKEKIVPYDFFDLQDQAPREAVDMAYTSQVLYLQSLLESALSKSESQTNYYRQLLTFVNAAYEGIKNPQSQELNTLLAEQRAAAYKRLNEMDTEEDKARAVRIARMREIVKEQGYSFDDKDNTVCEAEASCELPSRRGRRSGADKPPRQ